MNRFLLCFFAAGSVRRLVYVLAALLLFWVGVSDANAVGTGARCQNLNPYCDQGQALANCMAYRRNDLLQPGQTIVDVSCPHTPPAQGVKGYYTHVFYRANPVSGPHTDERFYYGDSCALRTDMVNASFTGNAGSCSGGCAYAPSVGGGDTYTVVTVAGLSVTKASRLAPTGEVCTNGDGLGLPVTSEQCAQQGTLTQCVRPDGKHCATASTGKQFCWTPTEAGVKTSNNEAATKSPQGVGINAPNSPPKNGGDWQQHDSGTVSVSTSSTTNNYNVTSWVSTYGSEGDGGSGGGGEGEEEGEGDSASGGDSCDSPPACSADTLKCLQLRLTWKTECNTSSNSIAGGTGCGESDVPVCSGDSCTAEAYSSVLQQWRTRCDAENDRNKLGDDAGSGAADAAGDDEAGTVAGLWAGQGVTPTLDQGRLSIGGGSPLPTVQIYDTSWSVPDGWHDALSYIRQIIIAAFMIGAFFILWRR